ncbi:hypothetical protein PTKIN_Ptkin06aG0100100 [Pterospermum kingtungense]
MLQFDPISMSYAKLYLQLLQNHLVTLVQPMLREPLFPQWYDLKARCEYHGGFHGHSIKNCIAFK